ncbi:precorrin-6A/cobalt-precorrin-6A reductase [Vannielia litorea]|uniref:precorrin-6A/cobalt-precorrin-6A reductase n=1 Tax=Vannielia litorea TaxID=1217970 RepID=UPI001BCC326E|nr:precorrin-6A/cobalt-precorrin-6A reductase [Vannielia litorea]MBS8228537.1 cobalt-precorrin-6A reductase [Vannielia litorea]
MKGTGAKKILLLAGSGESRALGQALAWRDDFDVEIRLARQMRGRDFPVPATLGGFGGEAGFRAHIEEARPDAVIDATHPYAEAITRRTAQIVPEMGLPLLHFERPPWVAGPGDDWTEVAAPEDLPALIPEGACVFLGTGRAGLERFAGLEGRRIICRQLDMADGPFPFEGGEFLLSVPPFTAEGEMKLFQRLDVDWLVVKNAGGEGARPKLEAARAMGLPVAMLARPPEPVGVARAETLEAAMAWAEAL